MRRLEALLGLRRLHRSTRGVVPTEAGAALPGRLLPAPDDLGSALQVFSGPFPYCPGRRLPPPPKRAFLDSLRSRTGADTRIPAIAA